MSEQTAIKAYRDLEQRFHRIMALEHASSLLGKDRETAMPSGSASDRIEQMISLGQAKHDIISHPAIGDLLQEAESGKKFLSHDEQKNLSLMRDSWIHSSLPADVAEEANAAAASGEVMHDLYYKTGEWEKMEKVYTRSFNAERECGNITRERIGAASAYEACMNKYSHGMTVEKIEKEFAGPREKLPAMIQMALEQQGKRKSPAEFSGTFPVNRQMALARGILQAMGFDFNRGRLDFIIGHPSSGGSPNDVRLSARTSQDTFLPMIYATIHEGGHGLYDLGTPQKEVMENGEKRLVYRPVDSALGMDIHESQSLFMELQMGMSDEFIGFLSRTAQSIFSAAPTAAETAQMSMKEKGKAWLDWAKAKVGGNKQELSAENLRSMIQRVEPSFIRVDADEMTYPMHVILRFELERDIMDGKLKVRDLPEAWNQKMESYLGIRPPTHSQGCMQDVHWPAGLVGYFPFYLRGAMIAAQFAAAARKECPEINPNLAKGDFSAPLAWMRKNVHSKGSLLDTGELITAATGEDLTSRHFLEHLEKRYLTPRL